MESRESDSKGSGQWQLLCGDDPVPLTVVDSKEAKNILKQASFHSEFWNRRPIALARDEFGTYYYVDEHDSDPDPERIHVYTGWMGDMSKSKLMLVARDSKGTIFSTRPETVASSLMLKCSDGSKMESLRRCATFPSMKTGHLSVRFGRVRQPTDGNTMRLILPLSLLACGEQPSSTSAAHEALAQEKPVNPMRKSVPIRRKYPSRLLPIWGHPLPPPTIIQAQWSTTNPRSRRTAWAAKSSLNIRLPSILKVQAGWVVRWIPSCTSMNAAFINTSWARNHSLCCRRSDWLVGAPVGIQYGDDALSWISIPLPVSEAP